MWNWLISFQFHESFGWSNFAGALALLSGGEEESSYGHTGSSYGGSSPSSGYGGHGRAGHFRRKPGKKRYQKRYYRSIRNEDSNIDDYIGEKSTIL